MKKYIASALALTAFTVAACKDNTNQPDLNAPTVESVSGALTKTSLQPLATGVLASDRGAVIGTFTYIVLSGIMGRDIYRIDASEPRYVQETLGSNPDPGSFAGGGGFAGFYTAIRAANNLILSIPTAAATELSASEKSALSGFLKTFKALDYLRLIELRDTVGIPIQTDDPAAVTPVRCKGAVLDFIAALLDSANTDLTAAGGTTKIPFTIPAGLTTHGYNYAVVSNFVRLNRGLKGRVDVERAINRKGATAGAAALAVTELTAALGGAAAGTVAGSTFQNGAYYHFVASGSEATANQRADSKIGLNPLVKDSILSTDTRSAKIVSRTALTGQGLTTSITCAVCVASTANQELPLGILRDEELVLLRAQAYIETGDLASATADLNSVHTFYGNSAYATFASKTAAINALLYDKRYSLLAEGPQRWVDLREYSRLNSTFLRAEVAGDPYNKAFPLPRAELTARGLTDNPACT